MHELSVFVYAPPPLIIIGQGQILAWLLTLWVPLKQHLTTRK